MAENSSFDISAFTQTDENILFAIAGKNPQKAGEFVQAVILKSMDQGETWYPRAVYPKHYFYGIAFLNSKVGVAVGANGFAVMTTDGGEIWVNLKILTTSFSPLIRVQFLDQKRIRILSMDGEVFLTEDEGQSWRQYTFAHSGRREDGKFYGWLNAFSYGKEKELWILGGQGQIYKSIDDGLTWKGCGEQFAKLVKTKNSDVINFREIKFFSVRLGFIFIDTLKEIALLKTEDSGETWRVIKTFPQSSLVMPQFISSSAIWFRDSLNHCLYHTADSGKNWKKIPYPSFDDVPDMPYPFFSTEKLGWLFPYRFLASTRGMRTFDGGQTWHKRGIKVLEK